MRSLGPETVSPYALAAATPPQPLSPREMITDDMLRSLAQHDYLRDKGELSAEDQRVLAMHLSDLMGELLARRAVMRANDGNAPYTPSQTIAALRGIFEAPKDGIPA